MRYIITIIVALAFCLPAHAEILVFKTTTSGQQLDVASKVLEKKKESGYLVIEASLANPDSIAVNAIYHLHYETKSGRKIQYVTIPGNPEFIMVTVSKGKNMVLRYFDDTTGAYMVVYGNAKKPVDIGGVSQYVGNLSGNNVWIEPDYKTGSGSIKLKLDTKATKLANTTGQTATQIIEAYSQALAAKGYSAE